MTMSASCSIAPDSRRSASLGRLSSRSSTPRLSCASAITGTCSSLARNLSRRGDLRNLLFARSALVFRLDELQVVDDHHADILLPLEPPADRADLRHAPPGLIVDVDRHLAELAGDAKEQVALVFGQLSLAELVHVHPAADAQEPLGQFELRLFETEDHDPRLAAIGGGLGDVQHERGFAHAGPGGQDHQFRRLKTVGFRRARDRESRWRDR
jgi:hypothetical protein